MKGNSSTRIEGLNPLSRDHGAVLVCAQYGRKAVRSSRVDRLKLCEQMRDIFQAEIGPNLEDEQWILSPLIGDASLRAEFHQRHRDIRELNNRLCRVEVTKDPGLGLVARLANALDDYVRWEEHILYPRIIDGIEKHDLKYLVQLTKKMELDRNRQTQQLHESVSLKH